jgi:hypothetical protein
MASNDEDGEVEVGLVHQVNKLLNSKFIINIPQIVQF